MSTSYSIARPGCSSAEVTRRLRQMNRTNAWQFTFLSSTQEIESILQVLLVNMEYIGLEIFPFQCDAARNFPVETRRQRTRTIVVCVSIIAANNAPKVSALYCQFVHTFMVRNPQYDFVASFDEPLSQIIKKHLTAAARPRSTADQKYLHCSTQSGMPGGSAFICGLRLIPL